MAQDYKHAVLDMVLVEPVLESRSRARAHQTSEECHVARRARITSPAWAKLARRGATSGTRSVTWPRPLVRPSMLSKRVELSGKRDGGAVQVLAWMRRLWL